MKSFDAYRLGLLPWLVGVPFEALELAHAVAAAGAEAGAGTLDPALENELRAQVDALRAENEDTVTRVLTVEAILGAAGLPVPGRPSELPEYRAWFGLVKDAVMDHLVPSSPDGAALVIGFFVGELTMTLALGAMTRSFREIAPENGFLVQHVDSLSDSVRKLVPRFAQAMDHPELPTLARASARRLLAELQAPLTSLRALKGQVERLVTYRESLGEAFYES